METDKENTNEPTRDPQVYGEAKDGHAKKTKSKEKNRLTIGDIVALSFLINRGYSFGKLKINRARNQTALKEKNSIHKVLRGHIPLSGCNSKGLSGGRS